MRLTVSLLLMMALSSATASELGAGDAERGKSRSSICAACHGVTGISNQDVWPNLAGQKAGYLATQLKAYQSGARKDPVMEAVARILTDQEIAVRYLQFRTEHDLTATAVGLFAQRIGDPAIVRVRVTLAFMNNGTVPEVVTVGWILIGNCADMSDGLPMIPKEDVTPFVIGPNESLGD